MPKSGASVAEIEGLTQRRFAELFDITTRQVRNLERVGLPVAGQGRAKRYPVPEAPLWYLGQKVSAAVEAASPTQEQSIRMRKTEADARKRELEVAELEGAVVRVDTVRSVFAEAAGRIRSRLLNVPGSLARDVVGYDEPRQVLPVIESRMNELLTELQSVETWRPA